MKSEEYIDGAVRTNSGRFDVDHVDAKTIACAFTLFVAAGRAMDAVKRALYYGRELDQKKLHDALCIAEAALSAHQDQERYDDAVDYPGYKAENPSVNGQIVHAAIGMATESAEIVEAVLDGLRTTHPTFDFGNLFEEQGDGFWYNALAVKTAAAADAESTVNGGSRDWSFEAMWEKNIAKLKARYPEKFSTERAFNRDIETEKKALT